MPTKKKSQSPLTVAQAAAALGIGARRLRTLIETGRLPACRFGRAYTILPADLDLVRIRRPGNPAWRSKKNFGKSGEKSKTGVASAP